MIFVTILTSSNLSKLKRLVDCLKIQTNNNFDFNIVVNTQDNKYADIVKSEYGEKVDITESDGSPGKGKNSVVRLWRNKYREYNYYSLIDGDDLVYPTYIEALYQHVEKHPNTDALGMVCMDVIQRTGEVQCWTGNNIDLRSQKEIADFYFEEYGITAQDRLILFSKRILDRVLFDPSLSVYEDYLLSLKLLQLYRLGEIEYWLTTSTDIYIYDKTGNSLTSDLDIQDWVHYTILLKMKAIRSCHYEWSSTKDMLYEIPDQLMSYEERLEYTKSKQKYLIAVYSFGTDPQKCELLQKSADKFGYNLTIEGYGLKYTGHGLKIKNFKEFCKKQSPETVVMFVDAYDVIFVQPPEVLYKKWKELTKMQGVIFNAETNCHPDVELEGDYPRHEKSRFIFLNSGVYMGTAENMLKILPEDIQDTYDDQRFYVDKFLNKDPNILLDYETELFMPLCYAVTSVRYDDKGLYNKELNTYPCLLHANFTEHSAEYLETFFNLISMKNIPTGIPSQEQNEFELLKLNNYLKIFKNGEVSKYLPSEPK